MKDMVETFRPGVTRIFKHLPPECQESCNNGGFSAEDEVNGKIGLVRFGCHECACPNNTEQPQLCEPRVHRAGKLAHSQKGREFGKRYTRVDEFLNYQWSTDLIKCLGQVKKS